MNTFLNDTAMKEDILFKESYCEIHHFKETNVIHMELIGEFNVEQYKKMYNTLLEFVIQNESKGIVVDQRRSNGSDMEMRNWLIMSYLPKFKKNVVAFNSDFKIAGISTDRVGFKKYITEFMLDNVRLITGLELRMFESIDEAVSWIES